MNIHIWLITTTYWPGIYIYNRILASPFVRDRFQDVIIAGPKFYSWRPEYLHFIPCSSVFRLTPIAQNSIVMFHLRPSVILKSRNKLEGLKSQCIAVDFCFKQQSLSDQTKGAVLGKASKMVQIGMPLWKLAWRNKRLDQKYSGKNTRIITFWIHFLG